MTPLEALRLARSYLQVRQEYEVCYPWPGYAISMPRLKRVEDGEC